MRAPLSDRTGKGSCVTTRTHQSRLNRAIRRGVRTGPPTPRPLAPTVAAVEVWDKRAAGRRTRASGDAGPGVRASHLPSWVLQCLAFLWYGSPDSTISTASRSSSRIPRI